ncbi:MAG: SpoVR family protein [Chloroflexota bacterium]
MNETERTALRQAIDSLVDGAFKLGLRPPDVRFEVVPVEALYELAAYHFPERFAHWTHGAMYYRQKTRYDFGLEKIYELVLNTDPCLAYLLDTNNLVDHKLVIAHVLGHADFFRRNVYFRETDRNMNEAAARHAAIIQDLEAEHGVEPVEQTLDAALALSFHVDPTAVGFREKAPAEYEQERLRPSTGPTTPYDDLWYLARSPEVPTIKPRRVPPEPEHDLLRFLATYSPALEDWQRTLLYMVRDEWLYFYPNMRTKIMNEGYASFWHERILENAELSPDEHVQFRRLHTGVISSGHRYSLNPYAVGYRIWRDVERRWEHPEEEHTWYGGKIQRQGGEGLARVFDVAADHRDSEFIREFLTQQLVEDLDLYVYDYHGNSKKQHGQWIVEDQPWERVRDALVGELVSLGVPSISAVDADYRGRGELLLLHDAESNRLPIDQDYAKRTLALVNRLWGKPVHLETLIDAKRQVLSVGG